MFSPHSTGFGSSSYSLVPIARAARAAPWQPHILTKKLATPADKAVSSPASRTKKIEDIEVGDLVYAWDEIAGKLVKRQVKRLFLHRAKPTLVVTIADEEGRTQIIDATTEHPFWVEGRKWVAASRLRDGDILKRITAGSTMRVVLVGFTGKNTDVFNFEVEDTHNYFVGHQGVLVHNTSDITQVLDERWGLEIELPPRMLAPLMRHFDLDAYSKAKRINLLEKIDPVREDIVLHVDHILSNKGLDPTKMVWKKKISHIESIEELGDLGKAYAMIGVGGKVPTSLKAPALVRHILSGLSWHVDGDRIEFTTSDKRPRSGFANALNGLEEFATLYPPDFEVDVNDFRRRIHLHGSRPGVNLFRKANGGSIILATEALGRGEDSLVFGTKPSTETRFKSIWHKGFVRAVTASGNIPNPAPSPTEADCVNHVEFRVSHNPSTDFPRFGRWILEPHAVDSDLAATVRHDPQSLTRLAVGSPLVRTQTTPSELVNQLSVVLRDPVAREIVVPAIAAARSEPLDTLLRRALQVRP